MRKLSAVLIVLGGMCAISASADTLGSRMDVTASVVANCRLVVPPLSFGVYDPLTANFAQPADASTVISVTCTRSAGAAVSFDFGLHGGTANRAMNGGTSEMLHYQIYRDSARSLVWANGADAVRVTSLGIVSPQQLTVFGRIPPQQEVAPGAYTDVLTATVDF